MKVKIFSVPILLTFRNYGEGLLSDRQKVDELIKGIQEDVLLNYPNANPTLTITDQFSVSEN